LTYRNKIKIASFIVSSLLLSNFICTAQVENSINSIELPPLHLILDSALKNSPIIHSQQLLVNQNKVLTSIEKKSWSKLLSFNSNYSRGTNNTQIEGGLVQSYTNTLSNWYGVGLSLNIPLSSILNRKHNIENVKINYEIETSNLNQIRIELQKLITTLYMDINLKAKTLELRSDALIVSNIQFSYAEIKFKNSSIDITDFSKIHEINVQTKIFYEEAKRDYILSLSILEETAGIKLR